MTAAGKTVEGDLAWWEGDRPSAHGAALGKALASLAADSRGQQCATCAFREGSVPNQTAGTVLTAMHCVLGTDPDDFACHHGMVDGGPTRICAGYEAARKASLEAARDALGGALASLDAREGAPDPIRETFDRWARQIDPDGKLDVYQIARAALSNPQEREPSNGG